MRWRETSKTRASEQRQDCAQPVRPMAAFPSNVDPYSIFYLLRNRFYIGEVKYKGEILPGELFDAVQQKLTDQWSHRNHAKSKSDRWAFQIEFQNFPNHPAPPLPTPYPTIISPPPTPSP